MRLLGQLLGGSTAAFATMLASFLAGIALGSAIASRFATHARARPRSASASRSSGSARVAWLAFRAADRAARLRPTALGASVNALAPGALLAVAMLLPLTLCIGATFPFAVRLLARDASDASRRERARLRVEHASARSRARSAPASSCCRGSASRDARRCGAR